MIVGIMRRQIGMVRAGVALLLAATASFASGGAPPAGNAPPPSPPRPGSDPFIASLPISFDSEWIRLYIRGDSLEIRGTYWFWCRGRAESAISLFYPFPQDSLLRGARMVSLVAQQGGGVPTPIRFEDVPQANGARWRVPPCTGDTMAVEAVYRQALVTDYARYIVTTTKAWDRPLRRARFEIHLPQGAEPLEFSFPFQKRERDGDTFYVYEAMSFFPDRDIIVRWR